ncbi:MAG: ATP-binding protein [Thermoplasmata archaeon]|nr:ATP-binding protein [Thermoplasmata archaeon]
MPLFDLAPKETSGALFGRDREVAELTRLVEARRWVVVLGPRMVGKTSLVKAVRHRLRRPGAYVNLWGVRNVQGLVEGLISGFNESASLRARLVRAARRVDGFSVGPSGLSVATSRAPLQTAWDLLDLLGTEKRDCLVVLDEVQELSSNAGALLRLLGNVFNTRPNIVFVFTGSLVGLSRTLLEPATASPLFGRAPLSLSLGAFDRPTSAQFLARGARELGLNLSAGDIDAALDGPLDGTPGWLTLFGNNVAVRKLPADRALRETIREGKKVAEAELAHFLSTHDTSLYWPALKAIAVGASWGTVREYVSRSTGGAVNDGTVLRVVRALEANYIARQAEGGYGIVDPMVRAYVLDAGSPPRVTRRRPYIRRSRDRPR